MTDTSSTSVLSVRVNPDERALLEAAAAHDHTNLSDFIRRSAIEAAEADVLTRSIVTIPAADWEAFEAWVNRPAQPSAAVVDLMKRQPSWDR